MEDLFIEGKSLVNRFAESCEFDKLDGKVMKSTGSTHRLAGKVMRSISIRSCCTKTSKKWS